MRSGLLFAATVVLSLCCGIPVEARSPDKGHGRSMNPGLAFLMSAVLPGSSQLYMGSKRGYAYLGVEAAGWFARTHYLDAGDKRRTEYEAFARRHWSLKRYRDSFDDDRCLYTAANDSVLVHYWENDRQQYYESIGKYDRYRCGWDDFAETHDPADNRADSPNRSRYRDMRRQGNDLLDNARLSLGFLFLNRVVSGVDAFRIARARSSGFATYSGLRLESDLEGSPGNPRAVIRLVKVF